MGKYQREPSMPSDPQRPSWWRIPSPSVLLLVLLLSFLPWVEVGCENKVSVSSSGGKTVLATQAGFQIATGRHTEHNPFGDLSNGGSNAAQARLYGDKAGRGAAPLLFVFFISLLAAVGSGLPARASFGGTRPRCSSPGKRNVTWRHKPCAAAPVEGPSLAANPFSRSVCDFSRSSFARTLYLHSTTLLGDTASGQYSSQARTSPLA